jgi:hypothetical protein
MEISTILNRLLHTSYLPDEKSGQAVFAMTNVIVLGVRGGKDGGRRCSINSIFSTRHPFPLSPRVDYVSSLRGGTMNQSADIQLNI